MHEGKHGILDDVEEMDALFGEDDEEDGVDMKKKTENKEKDGASSASGQRNT
ncbi:hypothetical protein [Treponema primitia]|uniref:hypothetical protein n=1 Tax=Treponema primitia TaxID=88058 RepID=UPI0002E32367|nr:hypothetical protein [Treponema primitia]